MNLNYSLTNIPDVINEYIEQNQRLFTYDSSESEESDEYVSSSEENYDTVPYADYISDTIADPESREIVIAKPLKEKKRSKIIDRIEMNHPWTTIDITNPDLSQNEFEQLFDAMKKNDMIQTLRISDTKMNTILAGALKSYLVNGSLQSLSLANLKPKVAHRDAYSLESDNLFEEIFKGAITTSLCELNIMNSHFGEKGIEALATLLNNNSSITRLGLSELNVDTKEIERLFLEISKNDFLEALSLTDSLPDDFINPITGGCANNIATILKTNTNLRELNLSRVSPRKALITPVINGLASNSTLNSLNLSYNSVQPEDARQLGDFLAINTSITTLDLNGLNHEASYNLDNEEDFIIEQLGNNFKNLFEGLSKNTSLQDLSLETCQLNNGGTEGLVRIIKSSTNLHSLNISKALMESDKIKDILNALEFNSSLSTLNLNSTQLQDSGIEVLNTKLKYHPSLTKIGISRSGAKNENLINEMRDYLLRNSHNIYMKKVTLLQLIFNRLMNTQPQPPKKRTIPEIGFTFSQSELADMRLALQNLMRAPFGGQ